MFSATFPEQIQQLAAKFMHNYLFLTVGIVGGACSDVEQNFIQVTKFEKREKLNELLKSGERLFSKFIFKIFINFIRNYLIQKLKLSFQKIKTTTLLFIKSYSLVEVVKQSFCEF